MRRLNGFECEGLWCAATLDTGLDTGENSTGLLIVSGGNEIRSGAHSGQADLAAFISAQGFPIFRYDRRGVGESEGENTGFEGSAADLAAAVAAFRKAVPIMKRLVAFGNCDAASALILFHSDLGIDHLLLANPWTIETVGDPNLPAEPSAAAIRARYWNKLKSPKNLIDLLSGKVDIGQLANGLRRAARTDVPTGLTLRLAAALGRSSTPATILLANRDNTALAFSSTWSSPIFNDARKRDGISIQGVDSASHGFADATAKNWLRMQIMSVLTTIG
ncbi:MAG: hydrolase 1, exosortase A system-associated [Sphingorhabdus sp.]